MIGIGAARYGTRTIWLGMEWRLWVGALTLDGSGAGVPWAGL